MNGSAHTRNIVVTTYHNDFLFQCNRNEKVKLLQLLYCQCISL